MDNKNQILRNIPQVEKLLQNQDISSYIPILGHGAVTSIIRRVLDMFRDKLEKGEDIQLEKIEPSIIKNCAIKKQQKLQKTINGTGVIIHTNLGRSPISSEIITGLKEITAGYCNLEFYLPTEKRGKRGGYAEELISELSTAEDALIVNNNAAAVFLVLNEFARGREAIVSRSELIQIGGGFRIPDIMDQTGAKLVEVGTTNIVDIEDYENAINENTSMIFSAHQSNFKIEGFTRSPTLRELAELKTDSLLLVRDLGSGNLVADQEQLPRFEPTIASEVAQGPDIISFSGDKLLGGCQAGIIVGRKDIIKRLRKNPLMRMLRVDKITYYILQETLINYINGSLEDIALWKIIYQEKKRIAAKITRVMKKLASPNRKEIVSRVDCKSTFGGGSMPTMEIESYGIKIDIPGVKPEKIYSAFISGEIPIIGTIVDDACVLDFIAIDDEDLNQVASTIDSIIEQFYRCS